MSESNMLFFPLLLLFFVSNNRCVNAKNISNISEDAESYQTYVDLDKNLKHLINRAYKMILPYALEANEHWNLSSSCKRDAFQLFFSIRNLEISALKILDAAGKISAGFFAGTAHMFGDYDECMTTTVLLRTGNTSVFKGQYCMINVKPILPKTKQRVRMKPGLYKLIEATKNSSELTQFLASLLHLTELNPLKFGLCIPSGCSSEDLSIVLDKFGYAAHINATVMYCDQQDYPKVFVGNKIAKIILYIVLAIALIGTSMDYYSKKSGIKFERIIFRLLLCFSIMSNFPKLISKKTSSKSINAVFGIRSLSLFHIILIYEFYCHARFMIQGHAMGIMEGISSYYAQILLNGFLTVEVLFFLGGLLNCYCRMKDYEKSGGQLNTFQMITHRLWRIYPAYLFSMVVAYFLANSRGPTATFAKKEFWGNCKSHWWKNILFINNFFRFENRCLTHTWFVAADMHLYLLSLFTIPVLLRCAKKGLILHLIILIAGLTTTVMWAWYENVSPSNVFFELGWSDKFKLWTFQSSTLPHIAPYFTGIIIGYILCVWKDVKISWVYQIIGWTLAVTCSSSMLFVSKVWNAGREYTAVESAFYFGFSRFVYVLAAAWMVVCCAKGYGGVLNYIFSFKVWIFISRISYMMFLTSPILQISYFANLKMIIDSSLQTLGSGYLSTLVLSISLALVMVLMIESPFIAMEKILFKPNSEKICENKLQLKKTTNGNLQI